jgi:hypothetical protein
MIEVRPRGPIEYRLLRLHRILKGKLDDVGGTRAPEIRAKVLPEQQIPAIRMALLKNLGFKQFERPAIGRLDALLSPDPAVAEQTFMRERGVLPPPGEHPHVEPGWREIPLERGSGIRVVTQQDGTFIDKHSPSTPGIAQWPERKGGEVRRAADGCPGVELSTTILGSKKEEKRSIRGEITAIFWHPAMKPLTRLDFIRIGMPETELDPGTRAPAYNQPNRCLSSEPTK